MVTVAVEEMMGTVWLWRGSAIGSVEIVDVSGSRWAMSV